MGERLSATTEVIAESALHLEQSAARATEVVDQLNGLLVGGLRDLVSTNKEVTDLALLRLVGARADSLPTSGAELLNYAASHDGFAAQRGLWFNPPISVRHVEGDAVLGGVTERIVEVPFVFGAITELPVGASVLDVGAAESTVALSLASLGYRVTALDPRGYPLEHPNLKVAPTAVEAWPCDPASFDAAVCLSTVEHLGLSAYGEGGLDESADVAALKRLRGLLKPRGLLVLTTPFGKWSIDANTRRYDADNLACLLDGWTVEQQVFVGCDDSGIWTRRDAPDDHEEGVILVTARS